MDSGRRNNSPEYLGTIHHVSERLLIRWKNATIVAKALPDRNGRGRYLAHVPRLSNAGNILVSIASEIMDTTYLR